MMTLEKPWESEPDYETFEYRGFTCEINRNSCGALCGYVHLPKSHPYYDKPFMELGRLDVHGGIQFAYNGVIGFACTTFMDIIPAYIKDMSYPPNEYQWGIYRDFNYVRSELSKLVDQLWGLC